MTSLSAPEHQVFSTLLDAVAAAYAREGRPGGDQAAARLHDAASKPYRRRAQRLKPVGLLEDCCRLPNALPLSRRILACSPLLDWEPWEGAGLSDEISSRLFTTELLGPDGHIHDDEMRVGLLVSKAGTDYPLSSHSGEETYFVIAGEAEWVLGKGPYRPHPPGTLIHHPAWEKHGRRTLAEPFLGAWRWSGDLDLASFEVADKT